MIDAAELVAERMMYRGCVRLAHPAVYDAFPLPTAALQHFAFRFLSRSRACVYQFLEKKHKGFPYALFRLLLQGEDCNDIANACDSSLDDFSRVFLEIFGDDLISGDARRELAVVMMLALLTIVCLEVRNASIRRLAKFHSLQRHFPTVDRLAAEFLLRQGRQLRWGITYNRGKRFLPGGHPLSVFPGRRRRI